MNSECALQLIVGRRYCHTAKAITTLLCVVITMFVSYYLLFNFFLAGSCTVAGNMVFYALDGIPRPPQRIVFQVNQSYYFISTNGLFLLLMLPSPLAS